MGFRGKNSRGNKGLRRGEIQGGEGKWYPDNGFCHFKKGQKGKGSGERGQIEKGGVEGNNTPERKKVAINEVGRRRKVGQRKKQNGPRKKKRGTLGGSQVLEFEMGGEQQGK